MWLWMMLGFAIGAAAFENVALGASVGLAIGTSLGLTIDRN